MAMATSRPMITSGAALPFLLAELNAAIRMTAAISDAQPKFFIFPPRVSVYRLVVGGDGDLAGGLREVGVWVGYPQIGGYRCLVAIFK